MAQDSEKKRGGGESSEMFAVRGPRRDIPSITSVPLTPEEIRRRRTVRIIAAISTVIALVLAALLAMYLSHRASIDSARREAEATGRVAAIEAALAALEGETGAGDVALAARLHAMAALAGAPGHREEAERLLATHDSSGDGASDHRIAETYVALVAAAPDRAATAASALVAGAGPRAAEAAHARALTALALGNVEAAAGAAALAVEHMPEAPRYRALQALVTRDASGLGEATDERLARARVLLETGGDPAEARRLAQSVTDATDATPAERAWAQLVIADLAAHAGDTVAAEAALTAASELSPPGDEIFVVVVAEGWLAAGQRLEAERVMQRLGTGVSADASRRAQLLAEARIAAGELDAAEGFLAQAQPGGRTTFLRARLSELRGNTDAARPLYEEAARDAATAARASTALASMLVAAGRAADAIAVIDPLLEREPQHPRIAASAAWAHAGAGERERALTIVNHALEAHPREPALLHARASVHMAAQEWQPALEALRVAAEVDPRDSAIAADLGTAARAVGQIDEARRAFEAAIAIDPAHRASLEALLGIGLEQHDLELAARSVTALDAAHATSLEIERMRARWLVESGAGASGTRAVRTALRRHRGDEVLDEALANLFYQAEQWDEAAGAFLDANPEDGRRREMLLMRGVSFARARRRSTVEALLDNVRGGAAEVPFTPYESCLVAAAQGWLEWHDEVVGRAAIFARQAVDADARCGPGLALLALVDEAQHRDPEPRWRAAMEARPASVEAWGWLATHAEPMTEERCELARRYAAAAPEGRYTREARSRASSCAPR